MSFEIKREKYLSLKVQEEYAEVSNDSTLRLEFSLKTFIAFWLGDRTDFLFVSTYFIELAFSLLTGIKIKKIAPVLKILKLLAKQH